MSTLLGTDADETIVPGTISPTVTALVGPLTVGADADIIFAGGGNDTVNGGVGNDTLLLGSGDDVAIWNPGDGSDFIDGGAGSDSHLFNGSNANEQMVIGELTDGVAQLTRDVANINQTFDAVERVAVATAGGTDRVTVRDLSGTDVREVAIDLAGTPGSGIADGARDIITLQGNDNAEQILLSQTGNVIAVAGLSADISIANLEPVTDTLVITGAGGNDVIDGTAVTTNAPELILDGGAGDDTLFGGAAADVLVGGTGNDTLNGRRGNDIAFMGEGDDTFVWLPGEGSDMVEGQAGNDLLDFFGSNASEVFNISSNGPRSELLRDVGAIRMDLGDMEQIQVHAAGGADTVVFNDLGGTDVEFVALDLAATPGATGPLTGDGAADLIRTTGTFGFDRITVTDSGAGVMISGFQPEIQVDGIDAGLDRAEINTAGGDDIIDASGLSAGSLAISVFAGDGNDLITGSAGNDFVNGGRGADTALLGAGDDVFQWLPGEGSDVVEGQAGTDTLDFDGSNAAENIDISANGERLRFFRDVGNITMDMNELERVEFDALGGADNIVIGDLSGTDASELVLNLAGDTVAGVSDGSADRVSASGTATADHVVVATAGEETVITGLPAQLRIQRADANLDRLTLTTGAGNDSVDASTLANTGPLLTIDTGAGNDTVIGGAGDDIIDSGAGNDNVRGGRGADVALLGNGNDVFTWLPGEGSDVVEGGAGTDTLDFDGSAAGENFTISANGARSTLFRDVGNITMDMDGVERIVVDAVGGADNVVVNDLSGTAVTRVQVNLGAAQGATAADGLADSVTSLGTANADTIRVTTAGSAVVASGLPAEVRITGADAALDRFEVRAGAGDDVINASGQSGTRLQLNLFGEAGNDRIIGSAGNDFINGGVGADTVSMGGGNDRFQWNPGEGSDVINGQSGFDTHEFNGSNANENFALNAEGGHAILTRNVGNIRMDQDNVERVELAALGGTDNIDIGDLRGTDVRELSIDLAGTLDGTAGDGAADSVSLTGSSRSELINVGGSGDDLVISGMTARTRVDNLDASDQVTVRGGAGNDVINAAFAPAAAGVLTLDGGAGRDTLLASASGSTLLGGAGNDLLIGNSGNDVLNAGGGRDLLLGGGGDDLFLGEDDFTIVDFRAGAGSDDRIDLRNVAGIDDFGDVVASARSVFGGTVLDFGDDEITLLGVNAGQLHGDDFLI